MAASLVLSLPRMAEPDWNATHVRPTGPVPETPLNLEGMAGPDLVAACLAGNSRAFDVIVERHRRGIYQLCYRFVGNPEDAADLSQDVFLRAYKGLASFRGHASVGTWLYRIGVNVCLNRVGAKTPDSEPLDARQHVDTRVESPSDRVLRG